MPRVSHGASGVDGGITVRGVYAQLLEYQREKCGQPDPRRTYHPNESAAGFTQRPRFLLDALEAGKDVIVPRRMAEVRHAFGFRLPWDRSVDTVRVSPDDVVSPTSEPCSWYGGAADDVAVQPENTSHTGVIAHR
jgi:hypothetical protein